MRRSARRPREEASRSIPVLGTEVSGCHRTEDGDGI
jgi:hypothetical protein